MNKVKRPIVIIAIGYIIGIIEGLYLNMSIALFYICIAIILMSIDLLLSYKRINLWKVTRYLRYIKIYINKQVIIIFLIFSMISAIVVREKQITYQKEQEILSGINQITVIGMIDEDVEYNDYEYIYVLRVYKVFKNGLQIDFKNNRKIYIHINNKNKEIYKYGDIVQIKGNYQIPKKRRNYGGFDYDLYLKTKKILGDIKVTEHVKKVDFEKSSSNLIKNFKSKSIQFSQRIKNQISSTLPKEEASILIALLLGDDKYIEDDVMQNFRDANISHVLVISGMHISYLIMICMYVFSKLFGIKKAHIISIIVILLYMCITGFSPSIVRAGIMAILFIVSKLIYRNSDILNNIGISALCILIFNPYTILNLSFQLSFGGTIAIIIFRNFIYELINKFLKAKNKICDIISISISVQLVILPISMFHFNTINIYFLFSNLLIGLVIAPVMSCCFIFFILLILNIKIPVIISSIMQFVIRLLIHISKIGNLPFATIKVATPNAFQIFLYFIAILFIICFYYMYKVDYPINTIIRFRRLIALLKFYIKHRMSKKIKRKIKFIIILLTVIIFFVYNFNDNLKIHFVDVNQGDCTFIETSDKKTILIDGGGSITSDVGEKILMPYILDRGYTKIDYIIVSHFDTDHIGRVIYYFRKSKS